MKKIAAICCLLMVLAGALTGCKESLKNAQPDAETVSNGGLAIKKGDWVYYINGGVPDYTTQSLSDSPQAAIYRMSGDATTSERVSAKKAFSFYMYKDMIYFITPNSTNLDVYSIKIDGTNEKRVLNFATDSHFTYGDKGMYIETNDKITYINYETGKTNSFDIKKATSYTSSSGTKVTPILSQLYANGDYLYFYMQNVAGIFRIKSDGTAMESLSSEIGKILYTDGNVLYYIFQNSTLKRMDINTLEVKQITSSEYASIKVNPQKGYMLGTDKAPGSEGLYAMAIDGQSNRVRLHGSVPQSYYLGENKVYFSDNTTGKIYSINYDGTSKTELCDLRTLADVALDEADNKLFVLNNESTAAAYFVDVNGGTPVSLADKSK